MTMPLEPHKYKTPRNAVILSIGDELTLGQILDTNSAWLSARLVERGVLTVYHKTVPDDLPAIVVALREAAAAASLVVITGGLGPTPDDLTRQAMAAAAGVSLEIHQPSVLRLEEFFKNIGRIMPEQNRVQALCPAGAQMLENDRGTAPGIRMSLNHATLVVMPGVPHEMRAMYDRHIVPMLSEQQGRVILTEAVRTFGLGESTVSEKLGALMDRGRNPQVGTTVSGGVVTVRIRSDFSDGGQARAALQSVVQDIEKRLGNSVFGIGETTLHHTVGSLLQRRSETVATVEICTGGLIATLLTEIPGASVWFRGGWVVCANDMKQQEWGVPDELLSLHGSVSEPIARLLAQNAAHKANADYGLATTGIAGADSGAPDVSPGTIWIAVSKRNGLATCTEVLRFPGDRELVRERAAKTALNMLRLALQH